MESAVCDNNLEIITTNKNKTHWASTCSIISLFSFLTKFFNSEKYLSNSLSWKYIDDQKKELYKDHNEE